MISQLVAIALLLAAAPASAQTPPSASELAAYTGLHAAAAKGDVETIARLAAPGSELNARDGNGRTPLHVATFQRQGAAAKRLIAAGADTARLDNQRYDAITIAAVADDEATLQALLDAGASAKLITSVYDGTALIAAAHLGHDGVVRRLIAAGAPLDHVNNLEAVILGQGGPRHVATVKALVDAGADTRIADRGGKTPLAHARDRGYAPMVAILEAAPKR